MLETIAVSLFAVGMLGLFWQVWEAGVEHGVRKTMQEVWERNDARRLKREEG